MTTGKSLIEMSLSGFIKRTEKCLKIGKADDYLQWLVHLNSQAIEFISLRQLASDIENWIEAYIKLIRREIPERRCVSKKLRLLRILDPQGFDD